MNMTTYLCFEEIPLSYEHEVECLTAMEARGVELSQMCYDTVGDYGERYDLSLRLCKLYLRAVSLYNSHLREPTSWFNFIFGGSAGINGSYNPNNVALDGNLLLVLSIRAFATEYLRQKAILTAALQNTTERIRLGPQVTDEVPHVVLPRSSGPAPSQG